VKLLIILALLLSTSTIHSRALYETRVEYSVGGYSVRMTHNYSKTATCWLRADNGARYENIRIPPRGWSQWLWIRDVNARFNLDCQVYQDLYAVKESLNTEG